MAKVSYHITCCVVILHLLEFVCCQQYVGDFCTIPRTGSSGQCAILTNCPSAIQDLRRGITPIICGFEGPQSIVCCVGATSNTKPTSATAKPASTATPATARPPPIVTPGTTIIKHPSTLLVGDKSKEKCKEYQKYVYQRVIANAPPSVDCAIVDVPLIIGGERATAKEFPHMALIGFDGENKEKLWQCGGALISDQFVLTAGHCLYAQQYGAAKYIRLGELVLNTDADEAEPQDFNVNQTFRHPDYRPPSRYNDIALLQMDRKARLNPYVRPACLDTNPRLNRIRKPLACGWGQTGWSEDTSNALLKVALEYYTHAECSSTYRRDIGIRLKNGILDETQICAGSRNESKDTCRGDSGGPLQIVSEEEFCMYKIVGVTSFGRGCGAVGIPAVYTRVSSYIKWIEDMVWP